MTWESWAGGSDVMPWISLRGIKSSLLTLCCAQSPLQFCFAFTFRRSILVSCSFVVLESYQTEASCELFEIFVTEIVGYHMEALGVFNRSIIVCVYIKPQKCLYVTEPLSVGQSSIWLFDIFVLWLPEWNTSGKSIDTIIYFISLHVLSRAMCTLFLKSVELVFSWPV